MRSRGAHGGRLWAPPVAPRKGTCHSFRAIRSDGNNRRSGPCRAALSGLTAGAEIRRPLTLDDLPYRRAAAPARLAGPLVDVELLPEITRRAVRVRRNRAASCRPAGSPRRAPAGSPRRARRSRGRATRPAARRGLTPARMQRLARIDVADADDDLLVHQELLDRDLAPSCARDEVVGVETGFERLRTQRPRAADAPRITRDPVQAAEATWVVETQTATGIDQQVVVVVRQQRESRRSSTRRLPDMPRCRISVPPSRSIEQVLRAPAHVAHDAAGESAPVAASIRQRNRGSRTTSSTTRRRAHREYRAAWFRLRGARALSPRPFVPQVSVFVGALGYRKRKARRTAGFNVDRQSGARCTT